MLKNVACPITARLSEFARRRRNRSPFRPSSRERSALLQRAKQNLIQPRIRSRFASGHSPSRRKKLRSALPPSPRRPRSASRPESSAAASRSPRDQTISAEPRAACHFHALSAVHFNASYREPAELKGELRTDRKVDDAQVHPSGPLIPAARKTKQKGLICLTYLFMRVSNQQVI